jgi:hypothetical protein
VAGPFRDGGDAGRSGNRGARLAQGTKQWRGFVSWSSTHRGHLVHSSRSRNDSRPFFSTYATSRPVDPATAARPAGGRRISVRAAPPATWLRVADSCRAGLSVEHWNRRPSRGVAVGRLDRLQQRMGRSPRQPRRIIPIRSGYRTCLSMFAFVQSGCLVCRLQSQRSVTAQTDGATVPLQTNLPFSYADGLARRLKISENDAVRLQPARRPSTPG